MKRKICAVLAGALCAAILSGCSDKSYGDVYLLGGQGEVIHPTSSTTSTGSAVGVYPDSWNTGSSGSASSSATPATPPTEENEPIDPIDNYRGKWYYNHISDKRKRIYQRLFNAAANNVEEVTVEDIQVTEQDVYEAFWAFDYENPQFLRLGSGYEVTMVDSRVSNKVKSVKISYGRAQNEIQQAAFEARAETVLDAAKKLNTDYERLKYVHDWIVDNTVYTKDGELYIREADGPLLNGQALCEGYSKAFMYFAQSLGYPCICSVGVANLEDHMWNMVKIGNSWYNVDVTWDDQDNADDGQKLRHDYFLINDAELRLDHRVNRPVMLPNAPKGFFPYGYDQDATSSSSSSAAATPNALGVTLT